MLSREALGLHHLFLMIVESFMFDLSYWQHVSMPDYTDYLTLWILLVCVYFWSHKPYYDKISTLVNPTWNKNQPSENLTKELL